MPPKRSQPISVFCEGIPADAWEAIASAAQRQGIGEQKSAIVRWALVQYAAQLAAQAERERAAASVH